MAAPNHHSWGVLGPWNKGQGQRDWWNGVGRLQFCCLHLKCFTQGSNRCLTWTGDCVAPTIDQVSWSDPWWFMEEVPLALVGMEPHSSFRNREGAWVRPDPGGNRRRKPALLHWTRSTGAPPQLYRPLDESFRDDELTHEEPSKSLQPHSAADSRGPDTLWLPISGR